MLQKKGKKILIYFFLLCLMGSINNIELNKLKFEKIRDIKVLGLGDKNNLILFQEIKKLNLENIFFINGKKINNIINSNSLVEKYEIFKTYPSSLIINLEKTKFLARINNNDKIFLVGANGKLSIESLYNGKLPFIFGNPTINEFLEFKKIIDNSPISYNQVKNLYFFPSKRWDVELMNNIIIKLPKRNVKVSLKLISEFLVNKKINDIKIIDIRIKDQIILND